MTGRLVSWTRGQLQALAFESNQCLIAGAGSGKTLTLVELVLRLLEGRVPGFEPGPDLGRILALTYTEKAAREMRDRLRAALNEKIGRAESGTLGFWLRQRRQLDRAAVSTIHGFCLRVLRQFGPELGLDPDFGILEQETDFEKQVRRNTLLDLLQRRDPDLMGLLDYFPWLNRGRVRGVEGLLARLISYARTYGRTPRPATVAEAEVRPLMAGLTQAADLVEQLYQAGRLNPAKAYCRDARGFASAVRRLVSTRPDNEAVFSALPEIQGFVKGNWQAAKPAKDRAVQTLGLLTAERDRRLARPLQDSLLALAQRLDLALETAKTQRLLLDFDDLLLKTRDLLAQRPDVRARIKSRFQVVLLDEFQDTNRLQADITAYLLEPEDRNVVLAPEASALTDLDRDPRRLVVFGDPKQSIYRFRGAEVSVFENLRGLITGSGTGQVISLNHNFRSSKQLIDFYNLFFESIMTGPADFEARYGPEDRQKANRPGHPGRTAAELMVTPAGDSQVRSRELEARAIARYAAGMTAGGTRVRVGDPGRVPVPGDMAVLLRRFTHLSVYEQALSRAGLAYYTVRGQGFFQCPEVRVLINLLFFLARPWQRPALLGLLRSPLFGLSDDTLTRLVWPAPGAPPVDLGAYFRTPPADWPEGLPEAETGRLERTRTILIEQAREAGRAFPAELVEGAVEATDYLAWLMAGENGEQKAANVQQFIEICRRMPGEALYAPGEMARFLEERLESAGDDPEAQITSEAADVVRIMTIHQAKGLEFPIVFVPDCGRPSGSRSTEPLVFGPGDYFSLRFNDPDTGQRRVPADYETFRLENDRRERAEHIRLLYVAATRARDHVVFSGSEAGSRPDPDSWLARLSEFSDLHPGLLAPAPVPETDPDEPTAGADPGTAEDPAPKESRPGPRARRIVSRALDPAPPHPGTLTVTATGLAAFLSCPRRYYLEQVLELPDRRPNPGTAGHAPGLDPRQKGLIFHFLLETLDLTRPATGPALIRAVESRAASQGWPVTDGQSGELARGIIEFLETPWGLDLIQAAGRGSVYREQPLWFRLASTGPEAPAVILTGEIDLFYITPEGRVRLVDYKYAAPDRAGRYEPQVRAYALALTRAGLSPDLEAGLWFAGASGGRLVGTPFEPGWMETVENQIRAMGRELARHLEPAGEGPPPPRECPLGECGWKYACHATGTF